MHKSYRQSASESIAPPFPPDALLSFFQVSTIREGFYVNTGDWKEGFEMATVNQSQPFPEFRVCLDLRCWIKSIVLGGIVAGVSLALFQMMIALVLKGAFFAPMRMISAVVLGARVLDPSYPLQVAAPLGLGIYMVLSLAFAAVFALFMANAVSLAGTPGRRVFCGAVYGFVLWIMNYYVIATFLHWTWFAQQTDPFWQGFFAHVFVYGAVLGWFMKQRF